MTEPTAPSPVQHATKDELAERVEIVLRMLLRGYRSPKIVQTVSKQWNVSGRQAYAYIRKAREELEKSRAARMPYIIAEHLEVRRDLRREAYERSDFDLALRSIQDEAKLLGLYPHKEAVTDLDQAIAVLFQLAAERKGAPNSRPDSGIEPSLDGES